MSWTTNEKVAWGIAIAAGVGASALTSRRMRSSAPLARGGASLAVGILAFEGVHRLFFGPYTPVANAPQLPAPAPGA